jgi:glycerol-3-phosphate dehydrogenase (NAD(P)+)
MPIVTIIGNTSWGNALSALLSEKGTEVRLWARSEAEAEELNQGSHPYTSTCDIEEALMGADMVIWAVPSQRLRENVKQASRLPDRLHALDERGQGTGGGHRLEDVTGAGR